MVLVSLGNTYWPVVLVLGILYMLVMRFMLKGDTQTAARRLDALNLSRSYP